MDGLRFRIYAIFRSTERPNGPEKSKPNRSPEMLRAELNADWRRYVPLSPRFITTVICLPIAAVIRLLHSRNMIGSDGSSMARMGNIAILLTGA